ncbi:MAG TPA: HAD family hydrolase [Candidatus Dormibacteraeota bacterium]|nr:HAD family hydrolase [Candidatus Dormibacteraeota bacterium]
MRLALFDLDDTLIDHETAYAAWAEESANDHGLSGEAVPWLLDAKASHFGSKEGLFLRIREYFQPAEPVEKLWDHYRLRVAELCNCWPGVLQALESPDRDGWGLGIVTNGKADGQLAKIRRNRLDLVVRGWCISGDAGIRKPGPRIFQQAAERCGVRDLRLGWMIGDSLDLDVGGGRSAGLQTIWINSSPHTSPAAEPAPDLTFPSTVLAIKHLLGGITAGSTRRRENVTVPATRDRTPGPVQSRTRRPWPEWSGCRTASG